MDNTANRLADFKLTDELRTLFHNFETAWGTQEVPLNTYKIITVVNSDITGSSPKTMGGCNAELE
jgi:hypothetical protein